MSQAARIPLGIVEGFYGVFYTFPERIDLIRFAARHGYTRYLYAPKNDRQQRARWWEPYPERILAQFAETIHNAQEAGIAFGYAISPGGSICYHSTADFARLTTKLASFYAMGVRDFSLMLDDNQLGFRHASDAQVYESMAHAQADLGNRLYIWLHALDPQCTLSFVPVDYSGMAPFPPALITLGRLLHPAIQLCYTGSDVCSRTITTEDARQFYLATGRKPLIWDNYPVNDLAMQAELHLGPITGRAADLAGAIAGILVNPMIQAEASKIPLATYATYAACPDQFDPACAWETALAEAAGEQAEALRLVAKNTVVSCLGGCEEGESLALDRLCATALEALQQGQLAGNEIQALEDYLTCLDEATYALKFRMENLALRGNLLPWIEVLEHWMWMARYALQALRELENGQEYFSALHRALEYRDLISAHPRRTASTALISLVDFVLDCTAQEQRQRLSVNKDLFVEE